MILMLSWYLFVKLRIDRDFARDAQLKTICRHYVRLLFLGMILIALGGCSHCVNCQHYLDMRLVKTPVKLVQIKKPISPILLRMYYVCELKKQGVHVIRLGQTWKLILSSDDLFENDTAEINNNEKPILNLVAAFIQTYSTISIKVASYSNKPVVEMKTKFGSVLDELTREQAEAVLKYLTSHHTNARLIYAVGMGNKHEVSWDGTPLSKKFNRRVEISFKYYKDNVAWY